MATTAGVLETPEATGIPALDGPATIQTVSTDGQGAGEELTVHREGEDDEPQVETSDEESLEGEEQSAAAPEYESKYFQNRTGDEAKKYDQLIDHYAKRMQKDPRNARDLRDLKTVVDKELFIQKLKAERRSPAALDQPLTKWEQDLEKPAGEKTVAADATVERQPQRASTEADAGYGLNDVGMTWKSSGDAYEQLSSAWSQALTAAEEAHKSGNRAAMATAYDKVNEIEAAIFHRRWRDIGMTEVMEVLPHLMEQFIERRLGDVLPAVHDTVAERKSEENRVFALNALSETEGYEGIGDMLVDQGGTIEVNGEAFANTPLNQILSENPWILDIRVEDRNKEVADRKTYLTRYRAAYGIFQRGQVDAGKAKRLLAAGGKLADRNRQQRVRQGLNSGAGGAGLAPGGAREKGYMDELISATGGETSFTSL